MKLVVGTCVFRIWIHSYIFFSVAFPMHF